MKNERSTQIHYSAFAYIYDRVMRDVDYQNWTEHVIRLAKKFKFKGRHWLDLACGTGTTCLHLAERGYEMTGIDFSSDMLYLAREKARERRLPVVFHQGSMQQFTQEEVPDDFDVILCLYDSLNYLLKDADIRACFQEVYRHLRPGGGFIFDVTTEYNLLHNFAGYTFAENFDDASYIWENQYSVSTKLCRSKVTIYTLQGDTYERAVENHDQRVYNLPDLMNWLEDAGFENLGQFKDVSLDPPEPKCERIHLVARKRE